MPAPQRTLACV